jgi:(R,R)-butanediol dehydrogenase/meso-butanediol dehydrogenase/diacetyl reductase
MQRADPVPAEHEVVLSVARCGICGSDLHMAQEHAYGAQDGDVFGHEFAGEVVAVGRKVEKFVLKDLVAVMPFKSCGHCAECQAGNPAWCSTMKLQSGGYAQYAAVHERQCFALPRTVSLADGAIVEPLAVALHGVRLAQLVPGDRVLVLGAGPIGLAVAFWARRMGAKVVVVQDITDAQHQRALRMGATGFVSDSVEPVLASHKALGGPADVVFECVGAPGLIMQAIEQVVPRGRVVLLGLCRAIDNIVPFAIVRKEVRLLPSVFFHPTEYEAALDMLLCGAVEPGYLVSDTVGIAQAPDIFESLKSRTTQCKVLIDPNA